MLPDQDQLLNKLSQFDEGKLVKNILIPLLERMDFDQIELRHGVHERGVDLLCISRDELDDVDILAVQAKRLRFTGNVVSDGHLHGTLNQLSQCIEEPIKLKDGTQRLPNRIWLVSPYPLNVAALESSFAKYSSAIVRRVKIVDGPRLVRLLRDKAPEILADLGDQEFGYRERVAAELSVMQEASAFHIRDKMNLIPLYVHLDVSCVPSYILRLISGDLEPGNLQRLVIRSDHRKSWLSFSQAAERLLGKPPFTVENRRGTRSTQNGDFPINLKQRFFYSTLLSKSMREVEALRKSLKRGTSQAASGLARFDDFIQSTVPTLSHDSVKCFLTPKLKSNPLRNERLHVTIDAVLEAHKNLQIVGDAGAGKTTLLRIGSQIGISRKALTGVRAAIHYWSEKFFGRCYKHRAEFFWPEEIHGINQRNAYEG
jgi:hypothetical protein